jgi:hypothetical protein
VVNTESGDKGSVDYKTLFLGAAVLVNLLVGGFWSYWNAQNSDAIDALRHINELQWTRLQVLNDLVLDHAGRIRSLEKNYDDLAYQVRRIHESAALMDSRRR